MRLVLFRIRLNLSVTNGQSSYGYLGLICTMTVMCMTVSTPLPFALANLSEVHQKVQYLAVKVLAAACIW